MLDPGADKIFDEAFQREYDKPPINDNRGRLQLACLRESLARLGGFEIG